ncbi:alpha-methylacyl-CoA racemase [Bombyx mandarina]|uniref:Alpha-methylacyl-CoA racemase n=2 Tax=Bombyx TaxID=7090 RepID=A0A8R2AKG7_BOMMO|nr:alpha-methylacyl-CoA racemase [Bombyx mori]XP_028034192.1 alpha-methylacyl-CoA racemase [Bombyx mandarina]
MALKGIKVLEFMGLAPGPMCGTILADFGASVTVIEKIQRTVFDVMSNGKRILAVNLKTKEGVDIVKQLSNSSDVLLDTFRPGVMEKLGLGPEKLLEQNPRLIYARLTGYGQNNYNKMKAGHDINYVAVSGILSLLRRNNQPPFPPINLLGDFAGGSLLCAFGILLALLERSVSGKGQVVDTSMTQGLAYISTWLFKSRTLPIWSGEPGSNVLDGGFHFYQTYQTKDGKYMAVGALEPQFYSNLMKGLNLSEEEYSQFTDKDICKKKFQDVFLTKTQEEWCAIFDKLDACVTPVLDFDEIDKTKYHTFDNTFYRNDEGNVVPQPAPRLSRTQGISSSCKKMPKHGEHTITILREIGYSENQIKDLILSGHVYADKKSLL